MTAPKQYGNTTVAGVTPDGVTHDHSQLSEREALGATPSTTVYSRPAEDQGSAVRERVATVLRQQKLSPKVIATAVVTLIVMIVFAATGIDLSQNPLIALVIPPLAVLVAGFYAKAGIVVVDENDLKPLDKEVSV